MAPAVQPTENPLFDWKDYRKEADNPYRAVSRKDNVPEADQLGVLNYGSLGALMALPNNSQLAPALWMPGDLISALKNMIMLVING